MKHTFKILFLLILTACSNSDKEEVSSDESNQKIKFPYSYVDTKREEASSGYNEMILYTCGDHYNIDTLKMFCKEQKGKFSDGLFHIIVFFNKKENAVFPNNPLTGMYIEDQPLKNIKAVYTFNMLNGYSKLQTYQKNNLESTSVEHDI